MNLKFSSPLPRQFLKQAAIKAMALLFHGITNRWQHRTRLHQLAASHWLLLTAVSFFSYLTWAIESWGFFSLSCFQNKLLGDLKPQSTNQPCRWDLERTTRKLKTKNKTKLSQQFAGTPRSPPADSRQTKLETSTVQKGVLKEQRGLHFC